MKPPFQELHELPGGKQQFTSHTPFTFVNGKTIAALTLVYETYGTLAADQENVVLVHHALSANSHVKSYAKNPQPGWWETMVGPNCPIDTNRYYVICINNLGSCFGSSGPTTVNPLTKQTYRCTFPRVTIEDMVRSQYLLLKTLGIKKIHAIVSSSMGAMLSLTAAILFPESVNKLISISSCYRSYPSNIAIRSIQREIIRLDPAWNNGNYHAADELTGFILARKLAHFSYRNADELNHRFLELEKTPEKKLSIHSYLDHNARKFTAHFDANSYLYLTQAMDNFDVSAGFATPAEPFRRITAQSLIISVNSDTLFEPYQQHELYDLMRQANTKVDLVNYPSDYGHDTFLVETQGMGKYIREFLDG